jgi:hypothetical protein
MAINPNPTLLNKNTCYIAMSGFGKSQALKNTVPSQGVRHVLWDPDDDHKAHHFDDKKEFIRALKSACKANAKGAGFRIAWNGTVDVDTFEWWCNSVWLILDGNKITYMTVEELADVSETSGKASPWWGQLNRKCRKYGGRLNWTSQRSQEVSKTAYSQAAIKYIGYPNDGANVKQLCEMVQVSDRELKSLQPLEFYRREHITTEKVKFKYKK